MVNWSKGMLLVEGVDDPIAPQPHLPGAVVIEAAGVAEAGEVEPEQRHLLAVARRGQHAVDQLLVGVGERVRQKGVDLVADVGGRPRRSSDSRRISVVLVGPRRRFESRPVQAIEDEGVDLIVFPRRQAGHGYGGRAGRSERPVA